MMVWEFVELRCLLLFVIAGMAWRIDSAGACGIDSAGGRGIDSAAGCGIDSAGGCGVMAMVLFKSPCLGGAGFLPLILRARRPGGAALEMTVASLASPGGLPLILPRALATAEEAVPVARLSQRLL